MSEKTGCRILAQRIREIFRAGLHADADTLHYIRTVFSDPGLPELAEILEDDDNAENCSLTELLFFPDENLQMELEDLLEQQNFETEDLRNILDCLYAEPLQAKIIFPDMGKLHIPVPRWAAEGFLRRLNIAKKTDPRIYEAVEKYAKPDLRNLFKVRVRNSAFVQNEKTVGFFCHFLERTDANLPDAGDLSAYVLNFLNQLREGDQIYKTLTDKKKRCFRCVEENLRFAQQLERGNMEILLLQGIRPPQMTRDAALKEMEIIDRISYAVFGRTENPEPAFVSTEIPDLPDITEQSF